jgi:hypothetical protein
MYAPERWIRLILMTLGLAAVPLRAYLAEEDFPPLSRLESIWSELRKAPSGEPSAAVDDQSFVTLERTMCFGSCPVYKITLFGSGWVKYEGTRYVCETGLDFAMVDRPVARKLISDLARSGYFEIDWKRTHDWTDAPWAITQLSVGEKSRALEDYHGNRNVPQLMRRFEETIDEVAGTARWLPRSEGNDLVCIDADGSRRVLPIP